MSLTGCSGLKKTSLYLGMSKLASDGPKRRRTVQSFVLLLKTELCNCKQRRPGRTRIGYWPVAEMLYGLSWRHENFDYRPLKQSAFHIEETKDKICARRTTLLIQDKSRCQEKDIDQCKKLEVETFPYLCSVFSTFNF